MLPKNRLCSVGIVNLTEFLNNEAETYFPFFFTNDLDLSLGTSSTGLCWTLLCYLCFVLISCIHRRLTINWVLKFSIIIHCLCFFYTFGVLFSVNMQNGTMSLCGLVITNCYYKHSEKLLFIITNDRSCNFISSFLWKCIYLYSIYVFFHSHCLNNDFYVPNTHALC